MSLTLDFNLEIPAKLLPIFDLSITYFVAYGGRGAGKSYTFAEYLITECLSNKEIVLCTRETQKSMTDSVYKIFKELIQKVRYTRNNKQFTYESFFKFYHDMIICKKTNSEILFYGIGENPEKIKSIPSITKCWLEEAETVSEYSLDVLLPTIVRCPNSRLLISFNPCDDKAAVYKKFVDNDMPYPDSKVVCINYYDNPFCPPKLIEQAEYDRKVDYAKYEWLWLGQPKKISEAVIYKDCFERADFYIEVYNNIEYFDNKPIKWMYGLDFGFSTDPLALIEFFIYNREIYIYNEIYEIGLLPQDLILRIKTEMPRLLNKRYKIYADSSRPETIAQLSQNQLHNKTGEILPSLNIIAALKGKGSVEAGINYLKQYKIKIHSRCTNTLQNFYDYKYKQDKKTGEILAEIVKENDHSPDALRYGNNDGIQASLRQITTDKHTVQSIRNMIKSSHSSRI